MRPIKRSTLFLSLYRFSIDFTLLCDFYERESPLWLPGFNEGDKRVAVIAFVANDGFGIMGRSKGLGLSESRTLTRCQGKSHRITPAHRSATWSLVEKPPRLRQRPRSLNQPFSLVDLAPPAWLTSWPRKPVFVYRVKARQAALVEKRHWDLFISVPSTK